jgi:hypothetical protein
MIIHAVIHAVVSVYASAMSDEWRVSLVLGGRTGVPKKIIEDLRVRLGDDVAVSGDRGHIFLYAGTEKAADEAGQVARDVLALAGQVAEPSLLERWDPDVQKWRDPRVEMPEDVPPPGQRSGGAKLVDGIFQIMSEVPPF